MKHSAPIFSLLISLLFLSSASPALAKGDYPPLDTAENVNLEHYLGKWYEIARLPLFFEKGCVGSMAEYLALDNGKIRVINTCHKNSCSGKLKVANGIARVVNRTDNSKLKVSFFWPLEGDYWILKLGKDYEYAVVGSPDRKSLWILSRDASMNNELVDDIKAEFADKGFNTEALEMPQTCEE
jgi:apolipoprotein D and lipocalin family protein